MKHSRYILGIDQSLRCTGIVLMDMLTKEVEHFEVIKTPARLDTPETINMVVDRISFLIEKYKPQIVGIEDLAYGSIIGHSGRCLAGVFHCIVQFTRYSCGLPTYIINIGDVKKTATGHSTVKKPDMFFALPVKLQEKISYFHGKTTGMYDLADAYWVAVSGIAAAK